MERNAKKFPVIYRGDSSGYYNLVKDKHYIVVKELFDGSSFPYYFLDGHPVAFPSIWFDVLQMPYYEMKRNFSPRVGDIISFSDGTVSSEVKHVDFISPQYLILWTKNQAYLIERSL